MEHLLSSLEPEKASIVRRYVDKVLPAGATGAAGNTSDTDSADSLTNESEKASNSQPSAGFAALVEDSARMLQRRSLEVVKLPTRMKISPSVSVDVDGRTVRQTAKGVSTVTAKAQSLVFEDLPRFKDAENGVALSAPPHDTQAQKRAAKVKARRSAPGGGFMSTTHSPLGSQHRSRARTGAIQKAFHTSRPTHSSARTMRPCTEVCSIPTTASQRAKPSLYVALIRCLFFSVLFLALLAP